MSPDPAACPLAPPRPPQALWRAAVLAIGIAGGCAQPGSSRPPTPAPLSPAAVSPAGGADSAMGRCADPARDTLEALWTFQRATHALPAGAAQREREALADAPDSPLAAVQQALLFSRSPGEQLVRAQRLLDGVLRSNAPEARALHPVALLMAEQLRERQRGEAIRERLAQQLDRATQQVREAQRQAGLLRDKLEALAEIERTLPARHPPPRPRPRRLDPTGEARHERLPCPPPPRRHPAAAGR